MPDPTPDPVPNVDATISAIRLALSEIPKVCPLEDEKGWALVKAFFETQLIVNLQFKSLYDAMLQQRREVSSDD